MSSWSWLLAAALVGCASEEEARPQLLVVLDTDLPLSSQAFANEAFSSDAAIDAVRIEVLDDDGLPGPALTLIVPDESNWPISFGAISASGVVRLRIRVFSSKWAKAVDDGVEPLAALSVTRTLEIRMPTAGVKRVRVVARGDCLGLPSDFLAPLRTCVSLGHEKDLATTGVENLGDETPKTEAGTWRLAKEQGCNGPSPAGALQEGRAPRR